MACAFGVRRTGGRLLAVLALLSCESAALGAPADGGAADAHVLAQAAELDVVVAGSEPFVEERGEALSGLSVELWRAVASRMQKPYDLRRVASVEAALDAVASGEADVAVGPVSITSDRAKRVQFTQPYYSAGMAIASPTDTSPWDRLVPLLSKAFIAGVAMLLLVLTGVGAAMWVLERKKNPEMFPAGAVRGIGNGIWFALVTMTTVGYGDRVPLSTGGRIVAGGWMLVAMLTVSSLTAGIATTLTVMNLDRTTIKGAEDLAGRRVAVVRGTAAVSFVTDAGGATVLKEDIEEAFAAVDEGKADAVVHDRPILRYQMARSEEGSLALVEATYDRQGYGFALRLGLEERTRMDAAMLSVIEGGQIRRLERRFLDAADVE